MTTATLTLTDFLLARIAEDEAMGNYLVSEGMADADGSVRVLAECEAKRRIVELHKVTFERVEVRGFEEPDTHELEHSCEVCGWFPPGQACDTVKALAAVYADHPDYREEWRP